MTDILINDLRPRVQYVQGEGELATSVFDYPFPILSNADLRVAVDGESVDTGAYTVTGTGHAQGGTIIFVSAPHSGARVSIWRDMPFQRTTDFSPGADLRAAVLNDELDRTALLLQQAEALVGDSIHRLPYDVDTDLVLPLAQDRAGMFLSFDTEGRPVTKVPDSIGDTAQFALVYLGAYTTEQTPTQRVNQTPLRQGDLFFDTDLQAMQVYTESGWTAAYITDEEFLSVDGTSAMVGDLNMSGNNIIDPNMVDGRYISVDGAALDSLISTSLPKIHDRLDDLEETQFRLLWASAVHHGIDVYLLINTYIDDFTNDSGIEDGDLAGEGYNYDSLNDAFNCRSVGTNVAMGVPVSTPIGNYSGSPALIVDGNTSIYWQGGYTSLPAGTYLQFDLGSVMSVSQFRAFILAGNTMFGTVNIVGSETGSFIGEEVILGEGTFVDSAGWQNIDLIGTARYVRLVSVDGSLTGNFNPYNPVLTEIQILDAVITDMTLVSKVIHAAADPMEGRMLLDLTMWSTSLLNTDIVLSISRDDGTSWTAIVLSEIQTLSESSRLLLTGTVNLSAQSPGTDIRMKLETQNGADVIVHRWGLQCDQALSLS
ncbi:MAG: hypothetical protein P1V34_13815 [Alphaproteobacteria bacterium]|nr:hypothetical protein [Alphaproteobacteria bacterium]